jgi:hypothetical protein
VNWERPFDQPVPLPNSPPARTLRDAANYIRKLPPSERETPECRLAIQMLPRTDAFREGRYRARSLQRSGAHFISQILGHRSAKDEASSRTQLKAR